MVLKCLAYFDPYIKDEWRTSLFSHCEGAASSPTSNLTMANVEHIQHNGNHVLTDEKVGLLPAWVNPDLDRLMVVKKAEGNFQSWAESRVDLPAGALFARITGVTLVSSPTYSSVQVEFHISKPSERV
jgi:hypothetical protein